MALQSDVQSHRNVDHGRCIMIYGEHVSMVNVQHVILCIMVNVSIKVVPPQL